MYEVMARRYRPAAFDEVVGQEHIAATLKNAISRDRVAHAYMFTGGHGCGKTTMARILAKALVCEKGPTADPCGVCPICLDVAAGRDADVLEIDGASNNGIEQIRQLREQAAYVPTRARFKIYIIDEVHMLSDGAFNALLKTLEEPPRHVKFILATTDPHKVPDTILSRCQRFDFRLVPQGKLAAFFRSLAGRERAAISDDALDAVAANAQGSVRDGLVLLDQLLSFADGEVTRQDVEAVRGVASAESVAGVFSCFDRGDAAAALAIVDEVAARGTNVGDFLDQLIAFGRDLMLLAATGSPDGAAAYGPARTTLLELGKSVSLESALLYLDVLSQARTRVRSRALSNPMVVLEMAVARLAGLGGVTPVSELLERLGNIPAARTQPAPRSAPAVPTQSAPEEKRAAPTPATAPSPEAVEAAPTPEPEAPREDEQKKMPPEQPNRAEQEKRSPELQPGAAPHSAPPSLPPPWEEAEPHDDPPQPEMPAASAPPTPKRTSAGPLPGMDETGPLWGKVLDRLAENHAADFRHMTRITLDGVEGDALLLSGPPAAVEAWDDRRRLDRLAEAAREVFGRDVAFRFSPRLARRAGADSANESETRFKLTRHPAVDRVKSLFDGVIVDCQTAADCVPDFADVEPEGDDE